MFLKRLKIELPYDPAIPVLGIYLEKSIIGKDMCTPVFTVVLFTVAKTGSNRSVHQQRSGYRRRGIHIQWNITQPTKG